MAHGAVSVALKDSVLNRLRRLPVITRFGAVIGIAGVTGGLTLLATLTAAVPIDRAVVWGGALAVAAMVTIAALGLGERGFARATVWFLGRLLLASAIGAATAVALTVVFALASTESPGFAEVVTALVAAFATLLVVSSFLTVGLTQRVHEDGPFGGSRELSIHVLLVLGVTTAVVAASPQWTPAVLLAPFVVWAASRFAPLIAVTEVAVMSGALAIGVAVAHSRGELQDGAASAVGLAAGASIALALSAHVIVLVRSERLARRAENERRAALLRRSLEASRVGTVIVTPTPSAGVSIVEMNPVAESVVGEQWFEELITAWLGGDEGSLTAELDLDDGRSVQVHGQRVNTDEGDTVLTIQLVDVTAFVKARDAMAQAVNREREMIDRLHALARQKDDFVSAVSHELRTPLTSIVGFAEELMESANEDQSQAATIIVRNAGRLTEMVEDLLELSRMTTPNPVRDTGSLDLSRVVADTVADQRKAAEERRISVDLALSTHPALVTSSANALGRIATNLVSNAIKFTPIDGRIRITTRVDGDTVELLVEDSGPGISAEDEPRVFERFFRSADPERRRTPGTGLGLSIVQSLVDLLHGTVNIGRSELGGAGMSVTLPRDAGDDATGATSAVTNTGREDA